MIELNETNFNRHVTRSAEAEAQKLMNIKFDSSNEAWIIAKQFLTVQKSIFANEFTFNAGRESTITKTIERLDLILENEQKYLKKGLDIKLSDAFDELRNSDTSPKDLKKNILGLLDLYVLERK